MLRRLRDWVGVPPEADGAGGAPAARERRLDRRHDFSGTSINVRRQRVQTVLQLKDVSAEGACGISEAPLAVGDTVFLQLDKPRFHAARIVWVRNALVGFRFLRPLDPGDLARLHRSKKAPARQSRRR